MLAHLVVALVGLWLMAAPSVLGYDRPAATNDWIVGPLIGSFATVACWSATRSLRWANVVLGSWMIVAPAVLSFPHDAAINSIAAGAAIAVLSLFKGRIRHHFGGGWPAAWRDRGFG